MIVVKLGGSLYQKPELKLWLATLSKLSKQQPIVVVPGGGPFSDQVRAAQDLHHFSDHHAHHMAILAMAQFGTLITGIKPECQPFYFPVDKTSVPNQLSVWLPDRQLLTQPLLSHSWDVTSDSLALWLANQLSADQLIIVKHCQTYLHSSISELSKLGIIDNEFQKLFMKIPVPSQVVSTQDYQTLSERLADNTMAQHLK
ncbi:MAG: delta 1-pyrroline-5-carboxylate synthetase [Gammaproteobacteria bacterium]|nr:delta 1-pyrroline-5-carboxylate synthetase [Gammaproteobacteria bacterium]